MTDDNKITEDDYNETTEAERSTSSRFILNHLSFDLKDNSIELGRVIKSRSCEVMNHE